MKSSRSCDDSSKVTRVYDSGCHRSAALTMEQVESAVTATFGWKGDGPRARIAPACTLDGFVAGAHAHP